MTTFIFLWLFDWRSCRLQLPVTPTNRKVHWKSRITRVSDWSSMISILDSDSGKMVTNWNSWWMTSKWTCLDRSKIRGMKCYSNKSPSFSRSMTSLSSIRTTPILINILIWLFKDLQLPSQILTLKSKLLHISCSSFSTPKSSKLQKTLLISKSIRIIQKLRSKHLEISKKKPLMSLVLPYKLPRRSSLHLMFGSTRSP